MPVKSPSKLQEKAIYLVAEGLRTEEQIAKAVGISRRTLCTWKTKPEFQAAVDKAMDVAPNPLSRSAYRLRKLLRQEARLEAEIEARAIMMRNDPVGRTGMVAVTYKMQSLGEGESIAVPEYTIDNATSAQLLKIYQQASIEVGDYKVKKELTGKDGEPIQKTITVRFIRADGTTFTPGEKPPEPPVAPPAPPTL